MEALPGPLIEALRRSHDNARHLVEPLDEVQLKASSYASTWSIADVLSHLGSGAEIFSLFMDAGLSGEDPPGQDAMVPIWEAWNARSPRAQATEFLRADSELVERFESLDADQRERLRLDLFGMDVDTAGLARMRLSEHAIHTWDVAVALDPAATVTSDAVGLLVDTLGPLAARTGKPGATARRLSVTTSDPERCFVLASGESVTLEALAARAAGEAGEAGERLPELRLPAEALVRLVYGRLDRDHTPPVETGARELDELRPTFPGF